MDLLHDGSTFCRTDRKSKRGGGVLILCHHTVSFKKRRDLCCWSESAWIELAQPGQRHSLLIGCFYRPPSTLSADVEALVDSLDQTFDKIELTRSKVLVVGNFNGTNSSWCSLDQTNTPGRISSPDFLEFRTPSVRFLPDSSWQSWQSDISPGSPARFREASSWENWQPSFAWYQWPCHRLLPPSLCSVQGQSTRVSSYLVLQQGWPKGLKCRTVQSGLELRTASTWHWFCLAFLEVHIPKNCCWICAFQGDPQIKAKTSLDNWKRRTGNKT